MKPAIEVTNLSKMYRIGHEQKAQVGTQTFRDAIAGTIRKPIELITGHRLEQEKFWALKDVNFKVEPGEVLGIVGRNGSGKSTLLKILSRIVEPTTGEIHMRGKVASLLEVGTGFHPELTGRENIYFNGAILGMSQREIRQKFKDIIEFSEVEQFLDTPVKFYSSGMYVRLAFAVAAHLDPDILIVDEVLAVGDAQFQKKSLGKMSSVASEGRTVLFVSHNMTTIQSLCNRAILMDKGHIIHQGATRDVLDQYMNHEVKKNSRVSFDERVPGDSVVKLLSCSVQTLDGDVKSEFEVTDKFAIEFTIKVQDGNTPITPNIHIKNSEGEMVFVSSDQTSELGRDHKHPKGAYVKRCIIPDNFLSCDTYYVGIAVSTMDPLQGHFYEQDVLAFRITEDLDKAHLTSRGNYTGELSGFVRPILDWESRKITPERV